MSRSIPELAGHGWDDGGLAPGCDKPTQPLPKRRALLAEFRALGINPPGPIPVHDDGRERPPRPVELRQQLVRSLAETERNIAALRASGRRWPQPRAERRAAHRLLYQACANGSICPTIQAAVRRLRDPVDPAGLPPTLRWAFEDATPTRTPYPETAEREYRRQWRCATSPREDDQPEHGEPFRSVYELHLYWLVCAELGLCVNCAKPIADEPPERRWAVRARARHRIPVSAAIKGGHYCGICYDRADPAQRCRVNQAVEERRRLLDIRGGTAPSRLKYVVMEGLAPLVHTYAAADSGGARSWRDQ